MKFFLDQNLSPQTKEYLKTLGLNVIDARESGLCGAKDDEIIAFAIKEDRIIITFDSDFSNIIRHPPGENPGVIRLKVYPQILEVLHPILKDFFSEVDLSSIKNSLVIIENWRFRVKK